MLTTSQRLVNSLQITHRLLRRRHAAATATRRNHRPRLEVLEDRLVLSYSLTPLATFSGLAHGPSLTPVVDSSGDV